MIVIHAKHIKGTGQKISLELGKIKGQASGICPNVWLRAHKAADHIIVLNNYFTKPEAISIGPCSVICLRLSLDESRVEYSSSNVSYGQ